MKSILANDLKVLVWPEPLEHESEVSILYQGIYSVTLNQFVTIMFVPEVIRDIGTWPPRLPECIDFPGSEEEARLWTIGLSEYVVTPNSMLAESEEVLNLPNLSGGNDRGVVLYVSQDEFKEFSKDLEEVNGMISNVHSKVDSSKIENLSFMKFIFSNVIASKNFEKKDLEILERYQGTK
jgi:hypothetical protein